MAFLPVLTCKECRQPIALPLPIQDETAPRRIMWPWGTLVESFLCSSCWRLNAYSAEDCHWRPVENMAQPKMTKQMAIYRVGIQCDKKPCVSQLHMIALMPLGSYVAEAASLLGAVDLNGTICDNGHANYGRPDPTGAGSVSITVTHLTAQWS